MKKIKKLVRSRLKAGEREARAPLSPLSRSPTPAGDAVQQAEAIGSDKDGSVIHHSTAETIIPVPKLPRQTTESTATALKIANIFPERQTRGLRVIWDPPGAVVDIIFVHGLTGDSFRTWYSKSSSVYWPKALLPQDIPKARVLSFGYDADVVKLFRDVGQSDLRNHASTLVSELRHLRHGDAVKRKIMLVVHSLGGLVVKKALCVSAESFEEEHKQLDRCTMGICFLGTPHQGSGIADFATVIAGVLKAAQKVNKSVIDVLRPDSEVLADLQQSFGSWLRRNSNRISLTCFYEEYEMPGFVGMVVPKRSATIDGYIPLPIPANHSDMPKFSGREEAGYRRVVGELRVWLERAASKQAPGQDEAVASGAQGPAVSDVPAPRESHPLRPSPDELRRCMRALSFPEMFSRGGSVRRPAHNTCNWLLAHHIYRSWLDAGRGVLWILGHPGTGKTTLMKHVIESSPGQGSSENLTLRLSFFFYNLGTKLQRTSEGLLRSLLHGLLEAQPALLADLVKAYSQRADTTAEGWQWEIEEMLGYLEKSLSAVLAKTDVRIYIDALDECKGDSQAEDETDDIRRLIEHFRQLDDKFRSPEYSHKFSVAFSCRHYPNLSPVNPDYRILVENENSSDIERYTHQELAADIQQSERLLLDELQASIKRLANGSFQWVHLVTSKALKMHRDGKSRAKILQEIEALPRDLSRLYESIIRSLPDDDRDLSLRLFQWVCFAKEPLSLIQLRNALNIDLDTDCRSFAELVSNPNSIETDEQMERLIPVLTGGLAESRLPPSPPPRMLPSDVDFFPATKPPLLLPGPLPSSSLGPYPPPVYVSPPPLPYTPPPRPPPFITPPLPPPVGPSPPIGIVNPRKKGKPSASQPPPPLPQPPPRKLEDQRIFFIHQSVKDFLLLSGFSLLDPVLKSRDVVVRASHRRIMLSSLQLCTMREPANVYAAMEAFYGEDVLYPAVRFIWAEQWAYVGRTMRHHQWNEVKERVHGAGDHAAAAAIIEDFVDKCHVLALLANLREFPIYQYSTTRWIDHATEIITNGGEPQLDTCFEILGRRSTPPLVRVHTIFGQLLFRSIRDNIPKVMQKFLHNESGFKVDVNALNANGGTALCEAALLGRDDMLKMLLEDPEIAVDLKNGHGSTALGLAARDGKVSSVKMLLDHGASPEVANEMTGASPLIGCSRFPNVEVIKVLLEAGAAIEAQDKYELTALWLAASSNLLENVKCLLSYKANIEQRSESGMTVLAASIGPYHEFPNIEVTKVLLEHGAKVHQPLHIAFLSTPLGRAVRYNRGDILEAMAQQGISVPAAAQGTSLTCHAVHHTAYSAFLEVTRNPRILEDVNSRDSFGHTPLHVNICCRVNGRPFPTAQDFNTSDASMLENLLLEAVDINAVSSQGYTPLMLAIRVNNKTAFRKLIHRKAIDLNAQTDKGTALYVAVKARRVWAVKRLLEYFDICPWVGLPSGKTPLHLAISLGMVDVSKLLMSDIDGCPNREDNAGVTPLGLAAWLGLIQIVEALLQHPVVAADQRNNEGRTPLSMAAQATKWSRPLAFDQGYVEVVRTLAERGDVDVNATDNTGLTPYDWAMAELQKQESSWQALQTTAANSHTFIGIRRKQRLNVEMRARREIVKILKGAGATSSDQRGHKGSVRQADEPSFTQSPNMEDFDDFDKDFSDADDFADVQSAWASSDGTSSTRSRSSGGTLSYYISDGGTLTHKEHKKVVRLFSTSGSVSSRCKRSSSPWPPGSSGESDAESGSDGLVD